MDQERDSVIVYLTQNTVERRLYLKTSLYFLFRNFNAAYRYPVIICHEGDYDERSQEEVLMGIRGDCKSLVRFRKMKSTDFVVPEFVNRDRLNKVLAAAPVPYWRSEKYRLMCRWWMRNVHQYVKGYKYFMRLDDDSILEEPVEKDLFQMMAERKAVYMSNIIHVDCGICCFGMRDLFVREFPEKTDVHSEVFISSHVPMNHPTAQKVVQIASLNGDKVTMEGDAIRLDMPVMFYNNFHVTSVEFWQRPEVVSLLDKIDEHGGIFYYRWGDAPLQSLVAAYLAGKDRIIHTKFKYSKRMQREAFLGDDGKFYAYMPGDYSQSSCVTERH